jgi:hypothetical protein
MSFQLRSPGALPGHKDLELLAEASFTDTRSALDMQLGFPRKGFEVQLSPTDQTEEYAQYLGGVIVNNTQLNNEEKTAIGKVAPKAMILSAVIAAGVLRSTDFCPDTACITLFKDNFQGLLNFLTHGPSMYLSERPNLNALAMRYSGMFATTHVERQKAIQMTGLGLLQIDENLTQRHYESLNAIAVLESGRLDYELFDLLSD